MRIICSECQAATKVLETRDTRHGTRRRRECRKCGHRFTTYEMMEVALPGSRASAPPDDVPDAESIAVEVASELEDRFADVENRISEVASETVEELRAEIEAERQAIIEGVEGVVLELPAGED